MFGPSVICHASRGPDPGIIRLWEGPAPGAIGTGKEPDDIPTLSLYQPARGMGNGSAMIICPGGGYGSLAEHEGKPIAEWMTSLGTTAFVLQYRLGPKYHHPIEIGDAKRAVRLIRTRCGEWKVDPARIGIMGFSAGGHLASSVATYFDTGSPAAPDPIDRASSRPDVVVLAYPVITMTEPYTNAGTRDNLIGKNPAPALIDHLSNEKHVTANTPPCFIVQTADDAVVNAKNAEMFAAACRVAGVPVELHVFPHGPHGFGLGGDDPTLSTWPKLCEQWLDGRGFLKSGK
jgi:acetyl esterase/lipase